MTQFNLLNISSRKKSLRILRVLRNLRKKILIGVFSITSTAQKWCNPPPVCANSVLSEPGKAGASRTGGNFLLLLAVQCHTAQIFSGSSPKIRPVGAKRRPRAKSRGAIPFLRESRMGGFCGNLLQVLHRQLVAWVPSQAKQQSPRQGPLALPRATIGAWYRSQPNNGLHPRHRIQLRRNRRRRGG